MRMRATVSNIIQEQSERTPLLNSLANTVESATVNDGHLSAIIDSPNRRFYTLHSFRQRWRDRIRDSTAQLRSSFSDWKWKWEVRIMLLTWWNNRKRILRRTGVFCTVLFCVLFSFYFSIFHVYIPIRLQRFVI